MIPQTETKSQLERFDGGEKRIAQSVQGRSGSDWGSGDGGKGCGCVIVLITLGILAILWWRMSW